ncbi:MULTISPECIES: hypothetical protein [Microcystis]|jgi:hypothetical protein|nr:hypothetical protein [Microcystis aeruginosa]AVQ70507.1 hypothetical protein B5D77_03335 [Microcystis sp. MC19]
MTFSHHYLAMALKQLPRLGNKSFNYSKLFRQLFLPAFIFGTRFSFWQCFCFDRGVFLLDILARVIASLTGYSPGIFGLLEGDKGVYLTQS